MSNSVIKRWFIGLVSTIILLSGLCITTYAANIAETKKNQELTLLLDTANQRVAELLPSQVREEHTSIQATHLQEDLDDANAKILSLQSDITNLKTNILSLTRDIETLNNENNSLQQDVVQYQLFLQANESDEQSRNAHIADLERQLGKMTLEERINNTFTMEKGYHTTGDINWGYWIYNPNLPTNPELQPMVIYLHGSGGSGYSLDTLTLSDPGMAHMIYTGLIRPNTLVLMPQSTNSWTANYDELAELIRWAVKEYHADPNKVVLIGGSAGGIACFEMLIRHQELFCCGIPFGASTDPRRCGVIKIPVRIYHGTEDHGMGFSVRQANEVINENGGNSELIMMQGVAHAEEYCLYDPQWGLWDWIAEQNEKALLN